jgi:hypothetical protein
MGRFLAREKGNIRENCGPGTRNSNEFSKILIEFQTG